MPRRSRIIAPGVPLHIIQRGNNRQACFFAEEDYLFYLDWLEEYAQSTECSVHSYVLMTNHVHLLLTPKKSDSANEKGVKSAFDLFLFFVPLKRQTKGRRLI
jgi:putative transposase